MSNLRAKIRMTLSLSPNITPTDEEEEGELQEPTPQEFIPPRQEKSGESTAVSRVEDV